MNETSSQTAEAEHQHHRYTGTRVPWYVHLLWISFWGLAAWYVLSFLIPAAQRELPAPP